MTYDAYGNMLSMATLVNGATTNSRTMGAVASTNRLCSGSMCSSGNLGLVDYDDAGNLRSINGRTYTFDSQNMMATLSDVKSENFVYTADDERIWVYNGPTSSSRWFARGLDGKVLREYTTAGTAGAQTWSFSKDYVYRGGNIVSSVAPSGAITQFHLDHLGSTRLVTNASRTILEKTEYFPFGEESTTPGPETKKFTGHERDYNSASGFSLDYMHARYYSANLGRFLSVDPTWESADVKRPQSWNRYSYVLSNPVNATDPDGRNWVKLAYITAKKIITGSKRLDVNDGARLVKEGQDVLVSNRKTLEQVGRKASPDGSPPVIDKPHGPKEKGYRAHGHVVDAEGNRIEGMGHIFMSGVVGVVTALVPGMDADAANELDETNIGQRLNDTAGQLFEGKTWTDLDRHQQKAVLDQLRDQQERQQ